MNNVIDEIQGKFFLFQFSPVSLILLCPSILRIKMAGKLSLLNLNLKLPWVAISTMVLGKDKIVCTKSEAQFVHRKFSWFTSPNCPWQLVRKNPSFSQSGLLLPNQPQTNIGFRTSNLAREVGTPLPTFMCLPNFTLILQGELL